MKATRIITVFTANCGRKATIGEFKDNVQRIKRQVGVGNVFGGWQEIDEDDRPEEMNYIRSVFKPTHRFIGTNTRVPIMIPRSFHIKKRIVKEGSHGVAHLQPQRHVTMGIVYPADLKTERLMAIANTHFGRDVPELKDERAEDDRLLRRMIDNDLTTFVTMDANTENYPTLDRLDEKKLVTERIDYVRAIERAGNHVRLLNRGTVRLTGDGHNAHWANVQITWP